LNYDNPVDEGALCLNCGWRVAAVPQDVAVEVQAYLGKSYTESFRDRYRIGTGKPPISGWERIKRRAAKKDASAPAA